MPAIRVGIHSISSPRSGHLSSPYRSGYLSSIYFDLYAAASLREMTRGMPKPWSGQRLHPPPEYNFAVIPVVYTRRPFWDFKYFHDEVKGMELHTDLSENKNRNTLAQWFIFSHHHWAWFDGDLLRLDIHVSGLGYSELRSCSSELLAGSVSRDKVKRG